MSGGAGKEPCFLGAAGCVGLSLSAGIKPSRRPCGARKAFLLAEPLWAPMENQRSREQLQVKVSGAWLWGSFVVSSFPLQSSLHPTPPSLLFMNGLGREMQSQSDIAHSPLPGQASPSCLTFLPGCQGSPVSCSWHERRVGWGWGFSTAPAACKATFYFPAHRSLCSELPGAESMIFMLWFSLHPLPFLSFTFEVKGR